MKRQQGIAVAQQKVRVEVQPPLRHDVRLEGADGSGCGVARIDRWGEPIGYAVFVHLDEGGLREDDFAAHLEVLGQARGLQLRCSDAQGY